MAAPNATVDSSSRSIASLATSSMSRFFAIPELVELILFYVPDNPLSSSETGSPKRYPIPFLHEDFQYVIPENLGINTLQTCRAVCRHWREVIDNSPMLRKAMWLQPPTGISMLPECEEKEPRRMLYGNQERVMPRLYHPFFAQLARMWKEFAGETRWADIKWDEEQSRWSGPKRPDIDILKRGVEGVHPDTLLTYPPMKCMDLIYHGAADFFGITIYKRVMYRMGYDYRNDIWNQVSSRGCFDKDSRTDFKAETPAQGSKRCKKEGVSVSEFMEGLLDMVKLILDDHPYTLMNGLMISLGREEALKLKGLEEQEVVFPILVMITNEGQCLYCEESGRDPLLAGLEDEDGSDDMSDNYSLDFDDLWEENEDEDEDDGEVTFSGAFFG